MTPEELEMAYESSDFVCKDAVIQAYPMLVREGKSLAGDGINTRILFRPVAPPQSSFSARGRNIFLDFICYLVL